jgi:phage gp45-like
MLKGNVFFGHNSAAAAAEIAVDAGSYAVTGQDVTLTHAWVVAVDAGSYSVTGQDVTLTHTAGATLDADAGSYAITGQDVALLHGWAVPVDAGSYAVTGQDVVLDKGQTINVDAGSYAITGQDVTLDRQWVMDAGTGSYLISGSDVALDYSGAAAPSAPIIEVTWPGTTTRKKKKTPDRGLIRELLRQRDEALARWRREHEPEEPAPEVRVEVPAELSAEAKRAIRKLLAPHGIVARDDLETAAVALAKIELQRIEIEDEDITLILLATA